MGSTTQFRQAFSQAKVRSAGAHTNANSQQPANAGGGGGGGTGVIQALAGTGIGVSPGSGTGVVTFSLGTQLAVNAYLQPNRFFAEDYANVQAAFTAACNANGILFLPPGTTALPSGGLLAPTNYTGSVTIQGCGINVSILSGSGGIQIISAGATVPTINLRDFTVTGGGIAIDYNGISYDDQGGGTSGSMRNICVTGTMSYNSITSAVYLRFVPQFTIDNLNCSGPTIGGGGPTTTTCGITIDSCSNLQLSNSTFYAFGKALNAPTATAGLGGVAGWQVNNFRAVNSQYGLYCIWSTNQGAFFTDVMVDDGNNSINIPGACPIYFSGGTANACQIIGGEILLATINAALYGIELVDMSHVSLIGIDFTFCDVTGVGAACIALTSTTTGCVVSGCTPGGGFLVLTDATSTYNRALGNAMIVGTGTATFSNGGGATNSLVS